MNVQRLSDLLTDLNIYLKRLESLKISRSMLDFKGHQQGLSVKINGVSVEVTKLNSRYNSVVKRGYEMIHLGVVRVFNEEIYETERRVKELEKQIQKLTLENGHD